MDICFSSTSISLLFELFFKRFVFLQLINLNGLDETIEVLDKEAANLQAKDLSTDQVEKCLPHFAPHGVHISHIVFNTF